MKLYLNLTAKTFVTSATDNTQLGTLSVKQGDNTTLDLVLLEETGNIASPLTVVALPAALDTIHFGARSADDLTETDLLFSADDFTASGTGPTRKYTSPITFDTASILAKFAAESDSETAIAALADIEFRSEDGDNETPLDQWPIRISRDILRDTDSMPAGASALKRAIWSPETDTLAALAALPTIGRALGTLMILPIPADHLSLWRLTVAPSTTPSTTGTQVVPADFDAIDNLVVWQEKSMSFGTLPQLHVESPAESITLDALSVQLNASDGVVLQGDNGWLGGPPGVAPTRFEFDNTAGTASITAQNGCQLNGSPVLTQSTLGEALEAENVLPATLGILAIATVTDGNTFPYFNETDSADTAPCPPFGRSIIGASTAAAARAVLAVDYVAKKKTTDLSRSSTTTLADDPELFVQITPGTWICEIQLVTATGAGGLKFRPNFTGGTATESGGVFSTGTTTGTNSGTDNAINTIFGSSVVNVPLRLVFTLIVTATGTLTVQWAQNATAGTPSTLKAAGTFLRAQKIA